jgi:hypothetical protein
MMLYCKNKEITKAELKIVSRKHENKNSGRKKVDRKATK